MSKSLDLQYHAKERIPGLTQLLSKRPDQFSFGVWPGYYEKAKGCQVWDLDGIEYTDMSIAGIGACVLGYADDDVDDAVREAISKGVGSSLNCPEEVALADYFCELHPWAEQVRFARSGGEVMTIAIRIARAATKRSKIAFCGYHGWHDWYLASNLAGDDALGGHLLSGLEPNGVPKELAGTALPFKFNDCDELEALAKAHHHELAAIVMEPIRNDGPTDDFIRTINRIRDQYGVRLIVDEISAGFRLTSGGAHLLVGLEPDLSTFSKAIGNGYAIAAVIGKKDTMKAAQDSFISSTNWTERVGPTAALATLTKHKEQHVADHLIKMGESVQAGWRRLAEVTGVPITVSGMAPMGHFSFVHDEPLVLKAYFVQLMLERGFLASNLYYAMYAHTQERVDAYLDAVESAFTHIASAVDEGNVSAHLKGEPAAAGFKRLN